MSVAELQNLIAFALNALQLIAGLTNGLSFAALSELLTLIKELPAVNLSNLKLALAEYKNLSIEQTTELEAYVAANFNVGNQKIATIVETAFDFLLGLSGVIGPFLPVLSVTKKKQGE